MTKTPPPHYNQYMTCYNPLSAFDTGILTKNNKIKYVIRSNGTQRTSFNGHILYDYKLVPCGRCIGCRLDYASSWSKRIMLEKSLYKDSECHFLTLTYDDDHVPIEVKKRDLQLFMKKLRKHYINDKIRFFACGEYGSTTFRPHYHLILFGLTIDDLKPIHKLDPKSLMTSKIISDIWSYGNIAIGEVNLKTAGYVAQYVIKKRTYRDDSEVIKYVSDPFVLMSRRPGIGSDAFKLEWFNNNEIIIDGKIFKPGKFFNKLFDDKGFNRDGFRQYDDMRMEKKFSDHENYFKFLHDQEEYKINETKILNQRERFNNA